MSYDDLTDASSCVLPPASGAPDRLRIAASGVLADARFDPVALAAFETAPGDEDIRLVLAHRPRVVTSLAPDTRVDLVVAGHTHGGQVAFPWIGPPIVLSPLPNRVAAGGLHALDGRRLYISRGVGMERFQAPRIRFLVPPEVTLLTLEREA